MKTLYEQLKELLAKGFYPDEFLKAARLASEASWQAGRPLGLYVLSQILFSLADEWPEQGIEAARAEEMERIMEPPITAFVTAGASDLTSEEEIPYLNDMVQALLRWHAPR